VTCSDSRTAGAERVKLAWHVNVLTLMAHRLSAWPGHLQWQRQATVQTAAASVAVA